MTNHISFLHFKCENGHHCYINERKLPSQSYISQLNTCTEMEKKDRVARSKKQRKIESTSATPREQGDAFQESVEGIF